MSGRQFGGLLGDLLGHPFRTVIFAGKFLAFTHLFFEYGIQTAPAQGPSMLPTFELLGQWLVVSRRHRFGRNVEVGDLVAYNIPVDENVGVKRILGLPGDYIMLDTPGRESQAMIQVPQGHCWIVGDNLAASRDSRYFGPVPLALIRGKVVATIKPFHFQWVEKNPFHRENRSPAI
ncbi:peptidase S24/S26A/S26B/S26C [Lasiosphaeria hispida]|uniref:Peptidase S24/S26A/S26B/S26C n=1 Tax=Lasiosphaeria hispida TaxID=260671 RepID=A0AAJ0HQ73_9PEZI|nr:peptidase S24/S26A/S26B/S26C [Lasiosphaeria hispida]